MPGMSSKRVNVEVLLSKLRKVSSVKLRVPTLSLKTLLDYHLWGNVELLVVGLCEHLQYGQDLPEAVMEDVSTLLRLYGDRRAERRKERRQLMGGATAQNAAREESFRGLLTSRTLKLCERMGHTLKLRKTKTAPLLTDKAVCYSVLMFLATSAMDIDPVSARAAEAAISERVSSSATPRRRIEGKSPGSITTSSSSASTRPLQHTRQVQEVSPAQAEEHIVLREAIFPPSPSTPEGKTQQRRGRPAWVSDVDDLERHSSPPSETYFVDNEDVAALSPRKLAMQAASVAVSPSPSHREDQRRERMSSLDTLIRKARQSVNESNSISDDDEGRNSGFLEDADEIEEEEVNAMEGQVDLNDPIYGFSREKLVALVVRLRADKRNLKRKLTASQQDFKALARDQELRGDREESFSGLHHAEAQDERRLLLLKAQQLQMERQLRLVDSGMKLRRNALRDSQQWLMSVKEAVQQGGADREKQAKDADAIVEMVDRALGRLDEAERVSLLDRVGLLAYAKEGRNLLAADVYGARGRRGEHINLEKVHGLNELLRTVRQQLEVAHAELVREGVPLSSARSLLDQSLNASPSRGGRRQSHSGDAKQQENGDAVSAALAGVRQLLHEFDSLAVLVPQTADDFKSKSGADLTHRSAVHVLSELEATGRISFTLKELQSALRNSEADASGNALQLSRLQAEAQCYKHCHQECVGATEQLLERVSGLYNQFQISRNDAYKQVCDTVREAVEGWQHADDASRQDASRRLVAAVQSVCPDIERMLVTKRPVSEMSRNQGQGMLVRSFRSGLDQAYARFEAHLRSLGSDS